MREVPERLHLVWLYWLEEQKNKPDRTDHYLMQVAAEVRRSRLADPSRVVLEDLKIPFVSKSDTTPTRKPVTDEDRKRAAQDARNRHFAMIGFDSTKA